MIVRTRRAMLVALLGQMLLPGMMVQSVAPDRTAADFYRWYLREFAARRSPLSERETEGSRVLRRYVSLPLLREIDRKRHSEEGLDADPFLQAQDYLNDWVKNVAVSETKVGVRVASTVVTLGERRESRQRLAVGLVEDAEGWKIRRVERLGR